MQAFIVRPFGTQGGIDFDSVHQKLIAPALEASGIAGGTTGNILEAGNIRGSQVTNRSAGGGARLKAQDIDNSTVDNESGKQ